MKKIVYTILAWFAHRIIQKYKPQVVGITGSVGKTSTKEIVATVLRADFTVRATEKSYNNEFGLPLTVIGMPSPGKSIFGWLNVLWRATGLLLLTSDYPEVLVLEMGADHPGDIKKLTTIAPCSVGIVTAIAPVHIEYFGSVPAILQEKRKILTHMDETGVAIYNNDDPRLAEQKTTDISARILTYGFDSESDVYAFDVKHKRSSGDVAGDLQGIQGKISYQDSVVPFLLPDALAMHSVYAALAATAAGAALGMNLVTISERLREFHTPPGRLRLIPGKNSITLIDDTYNSSPEAAKAALSVLSDYPKATGAKTFAVLGDMRELGNMSEQLHREVGMFVAEIAVDCVVTFGPESQKIHDGALEAGMPAAKLFHAQSHDEVVDFIEKNTHPGDVVLLKGSQNTIRLEKVVKRLMLQPERAAELLVRQGKEWD